MKVQIAPQRGGKKRLVLHPSTRQPFPAGVFDLSDRDLSDPRIRRLFRPAGEVGGLGGGCFGDLMQAVAGADQITGDDHD